jgi:hypothetical protein
MGAKLVHKRGGTFFLNPDKKCCMREPSTGSDLQERNTVMRRKMKNIYTSPILSFPSSPSSQDSPFAEPSRNC